MLLADSTSLPLAGPSSASSRPAYLVKFPEDVWNHILASRGEGLNISANGESISLSLPGQEALSLSTNPLGASTEIYHLRDVLHPLGTASVRLSVPFSAAATSRVANKLRAQNDALDRERKERADRVISGTAAKIKHESSQPIMRSVSSPGTPVKPAASSTVPIIPLKTRVIQFLALGAASVQDIVGRVGGLEGDVSRVVKVVGRQVAENPPRYSLQPSQYSKIKIGGWRYTYEEQKRVVELAKAAFDELELPAGAQERIDLESKQHDALSGSTSSSSSNNDLPIVVTPETVPLPSPTPSAATVKPAVSKTKAAGKPKGVVAREMAKFRAERERASSMPSAKGINGLASPRLGPVKTPDKVAGTAKAAAKRKRASPDFTSSEEEDAGRGRSKVRIENGSPVRFKRKSPPQALDLSRQAPASTSTTQRPGDPEALRDRYEELYPAYQLLTAKLVKLHRAAEHAESGDAGEDLVKEEEAERMVRKWEKWHVELADIRQWFGTPA